MKKKIFLIILSLICVSACALGLAACNLFGGNNNDSGRQCVIYHLNGGHIRGDTLQRDEYEYYLPDFYYAGFSPLKAQKDTWALENWYFDGELTDAYTDEGFEKLRNKGNDIHLYAKWIDEITITKDNFTEFFKVTSKWNGGLNVGNAAISYSITPLMAFDPEYSAENFELEITTMLSSNNSVVWNGGKAVITLSSENDYSFSGIKLIDSSGSGVIFDIGGKTLDYNLKTESFKMKLLHKVPIEITLNLDGGECEKDTLTVNGSEKLLKNSLPTPQKEGYKFLGWFTDVDFKTEYEDWVVTRPRTIYAKFVKLITVTYHMNGAEEKQPEIYLVGDFVSVGSDPVKENYKFFGYYTTPDFKEDSKFTSQYVREEQDIDLYARWEAIRTITFQTNGGSEKEAIQVADTEIPNLGNNPTKGVLVFYNWYTDEECTKRYEPSPVDGDMTLYAFWVEELRFMNQNVEALKEYLDIEFKDERIDGILTLTLTITIKEKYREYGFILMANWYVNLFDDSGNDFGNGYLGTSSQMTLSTLNGKLTATGVYTADKYHSNNDATVFELSVGSLWGYVYIPEGGFTD